MPFETDSQTLQDLSLIGINGHRAILELFKPVTLGGMIMLKELFDHPLNEISPIQNRLDAIRFLGTAKLPIRLDKEEADFIEYYLKTPDRAEAFSRTRAIKSWFNNWLKPSNPYYIISRGVRLLVYTLHHLQDMLSPHTGKLPILLSDLQLQAEALLNHIRTKLVQKSRDGKSFSEFEKEELDHLFRHIKKQEVTILLLAVYQLDIFISAANTVKHLNFNYPEITDVDAPRLVLEDFFHPFVKDGVGNDIAFDHCKNICFITGANMAGKSTLLKSIGVCIYLAHLGFPVPAAAMRTTIFNGIFTTINLSDNIVLGHSHFYREVLRIKEVAIKVGTIKNILVIFDELFRGTNVKDAYDASLAIIKAFTGVKSSVFIISTHIVEVADELLEANNLFFNCLTTTMQNDKAIYTYKLQPGVSNERLGMRIVEEEGLVETIRKQEDSG